MSYYPPPPPVPPHGVQYGYAPGPSNQRPAPPFYVNGQQPPPQPNGAFYQNQALPPVNHQAMGQNAPQYQQFLSHFQSGSLPPPFAPPPHSQYQYQYQQPQYPSVQVQQARPMQPQAPVAMPQTYAYSGPASVQTMPAYSPSYGFPRVTSQGDAQASSEVPRREGEEGHLESDDRADHIQERPGYEESNAYRPDFSSIIQGPVVNSMRYEECLAHEKRPSVDFSTDSPNAKVPTLNNSLQPNAQDARASQSKTSNRAVSSSPSSSLPYNGIMTSSNKDTSEKPVSAADLGQSEMADPHFDSVGHAAERVDATSSTVPASDDDFDDPVVFERKKQQAKDFLALLYRHGYGYSHLVQENLDPVQLRQYYAELGIPVPDESAANSEQKTSPGQAPDPPSSAVPESVREELATSVVQNQMDQAEESHPPTALASSAGQPKLSPPDASATQPATSEFAAPVAPTTLAEVTASIAAPSSSSVPIAVNEKPAAAASRADYIARLKAARAGKSAESEKPTASVPTDPVDQLGATVAIESVQKTGKDLISGAHTHSESQTLTTKSPATPLETPKSNITRPEEDAAAVAQKKREAQTELARSKMEALNKNRAKAVQEPLPSTPSGIPGLTLISTPQNTTSSDQISVQHSPETNLAPLAGRLRKRPVASDFDDATPQPVTKKPFGQPRSENMDEPIIIEASDDETEDEDTGATLGKTANESQPERSTTAAEKTTIRDLQLADLPPRPTGSRKNTGLGSPVVGPSPSVQTPGALTPGSARTPADLDKYNTEIEMMKKKIKLMEQRKKLQKTENSRPQTPVKNQQPNSDSLPPSSPAVALSKVEGDFVAGVSTQTLPGLAARTPSSLDPASKTEESSINALKTQTQQSAVAFPTGKQNTAIQAPSTPQTTLRAGTSSPTMQSESERKRRAEIQSRLSTYNAAAEAKKARLEQLRKEMEEIEEQTRKEEQEKADLAAELERLGVDTEGMPKEQMQAKKDEIVQQQEVDARVEYVKAEPTKATDSQVRVETRVQNDNVESSGNAAALSGQLEENDPGKITNTASIGQQLSVALQSPESTGDDAMVIDESSPEQSIDEGELSDGGAQPPEGPQDAYRSPSQLGSQDQASSVMVPNTVGSASPEYEPPQIEPLSPSANLVNVRPTRDITSSPASSSTDASMVDARSVQDDQTASHPFALDGATTDSLYRADDVLATGMVENGIAAALGQDVDAHSKDVRPFDKDIVADIVISENIVQSVTDSMPVAITEDTAAPIVVQTGQPPKVESGTIVDTHAPDAGDYNRSVDVTTTAAEVSDDESDLYAQSNTDMLAAEATGPANNEFSTITATTNADPSTVIQSTSNVDFGDTDDDDDLYEPTDSFTRPAPVPALPSAPEPTHKPPMDNTSTHSSESDGDEMDVVESSDADEPAHTFSANMSSLKGGSDDLAPELQPTMEQQQATEDDIDAAESSAGATKFTAYDSPLKSFKAYRFHPHYPTNVSGGFRSMTYSHNIDVDKELCPFETAGGHCNDAQCQYQHFAKMGVTDDVVLLQMGTMNPGRTDEEKKEWTNGLRLVIKSLREKGAQDAEAVAKEIADYRRRFLGDPAMVLNI